MKGNPNYQARPCVIFLQDCVRRSPSTRMIAGARGSDFFFPKSPITLLGPKCAAAHCSYSIMFRSVHPLATSNFDDL